ncbi:hypothetical protein C8J55DRAFT_135642 [Lentinula edodes]|uniref:Uncharacterized protein n=1 Tax=Lentinula lateritia TaxID=40482 RepID=A0A9W9DK04_9AGAR|nr:hypothetical protein C8J55DRAFT_135642 [Lentinula edodes]
MWYMPASILIVGYLYYTQCYWHYVQAQKRYDSREQWPSMVATFLHVRSSVVQNIWPFSFFRLTSAHSPFVSLKPTSDITSPSLIYQSPLHHGCGHANERHHRRGIAAPAQVSKTGANSREARGAHRIF